jgi:CheY-like chemotaxis protein
MPGGREALHWLEALGRPLPDVIISDVSMPEMDGYQVTLAPPPQVLSAGS